MVGHNSIHTIVFVFLISACFLQSLGEVDSPTGAVESKEINISGTDETSSTVADVEIAPGEGFGNVNNGKTGEKADSLKASLEEKTVEIKQRDDGKTKEVQDDDKKEDGKKVDDNKKDDEKKKEDDIKKDDEKKKEDEEVKEEGIDLKVLNDYDFEHLTQAATGATTGDWLILFTKTDDCGECAKAEKEMKIVYERVQHKLIVAKVVQGRSSKLTFKRFDIEKLPVISFFHHGKMFSYENNESVEDFMKFLEGGYQLAPWSKVREPYSTLEYYIDESVEELKHMFRYKKNVSILIFVAGLLCGISLTSLCGSILFHLLENFKDEDEVSMQEQEESHDLAASKNKAD